MKSRKNPNEAPEGKDSSRGQKGTSNESEEGESPLHEAFLDEIADVYNAEKQLLKALPKMAKAAQSEELKEALESHLEETENQVKRIEEAVEALGESLKRKQCKAMAGLIEEAEEMLQEFEDDPAIDAVIIAAAQKVEHYEIASYGTLCAWAEEMEQTEALDFFKETLDEEKAADEKLTAIAESLANTRAQQA